jgi:hypothetical protein
VECFLIVCSLKAKKEFKGLELLSKLKKNIVLQKTGLYFHYKLYSDGEKTAGVKQ